MKSDRPDRITKFSLTRLQAALEEKLDEIKLCIPNMKAVPWEEVLDATSTIPIQVANPNDDLEREAALCVILTIFSSPHY